MHYECAILTMFNLWPFARKEHKSHSPSCQFIALKKKVEELTVEEFFKLQKERHKFIIVCIWGFTKYRIMSTDQFFKFSFFAPPFLFLFFSPDLFHCFFSPNLFLCYISSVIITLTTPTWCLCVTVRPADPDLISFHSQNKSCNEAITKFEEASKLRRADIIKTAMGEE